MITIHNLRNEKPTQPYDVFVCRRRSILGNPYHLKDESERDKICDQYEEWFNEQLKVLRPELERLKDIIRNYGKIRLFCWCAPKRCHADTIKRWLEDEFR